jgi:hypothetical protein
MEKHDKENCDCPYKTKPKHIGRAHWVCPICGRDVSLEFVILSGVEDKENKDINK